MSGVEKGVESYSCSNPGKTSVLEQTWCEAKELFEKQGLSSGSEDFLTYLQGFREGYSQASQADDSKLNLFDVDSQPEPAYDMGYRAGYLAITDAMGVIEYNCNSTDLASEYKDRWCEAADAYRSSGAGSVSNPFVKGQFIDGYMTGGRVALTVPTSMEAFFGGENPEGKQPAIVQPSGELNNTELAFYQGFDIGYKAMIDSIRESINQVMQQMQIPNNMEFPEGLMPPPGQ
ncbi:hypothetical protein [Endozoicomonas sp. SCSIO W0465]|uniref:hypothetical protein n=1 Tax=Endozoicomonas sp. SCSIO W0465 TaxID=2918516 RepID=UPI0020751114|nr:hypothetical protein [Endozoicomonas sp. SCSIO W0465]USE37227.1 hypothetical protein MJO57_03065 [Endozoicomonas sp. SCSIO W0465]